ncbi:MAG: XrtA system polysaccharide deacetylase [Candidatus Zixiibacteriota bacterium]
MSSVVNLLTVDLEEWFVAEAFADRFARDDWNSLPSTVVQNTHRLLDLFHSHNLSATWFVLGWVAEKYPALVSEIAGQGHEIACHSYSHVRADRMSPDAFRKDTEMAIDSLVKATGKRPNGYRAPSWSVNQSTPWVFDILAELGFVYDSSVFPIKHDIYGVPDGPRVAFEMNCESGRTLHELPASTVRLFGKNVPVAGGGFFRHSPYWYSKYLIKRLNRHNRPAMFYVHPWELDPDPPRLEGLDWRQRMRAYGATSVLQNKIARLLSDFEFTSITDWLGIDRPRPIGFR